jgi:hypothetical protein
LWTFCNRKAKYFRSDKRNLHASSVLYRVMDCARVAEAGQRLLLKETNVEAPTYTALTGTLCPRRSSRELVPSRNWPQSSVFIHLPPIIAVWLYQPLLETDLHEWTSKWSTRGERKKWTFVKQILVAHSNGPPRRPRVDLGEVHDEVHSWTSHKVPSVDPKKNPIF